MSARSGSRWRWTVALLAIALVLAAGAVYLRAFLRAFSSFYLDIPLAANVVPPGMTAADALPATPGAMRGYDVVLVTLDTTRPDRIGCYGNARIATPNLDRLAREGVLFSSAVATASETLPSHASILTGLYPWRHGARVNSLFRLEAGKQTLAEILSRAGYATGAFVSSFVLDERFGLARGFDVYDSHVVGKAAVGGYRERRADKTTDAAIDWLRRPRSQPFLLWVHYYDPHALQDPPSPYRETSVNAYDGEIAFVDHELGRLLGAVEAASGRKKLVVVVADHGEAFGEHGELSHSLLVQEATIRIPLLVWASDGLGRGVHVDARVSQVDVMPTVLALLGVEGPVGLDGVDMTKPLDRERPLLAEAAAGRAQYGWARLSAVYKGPLKYVHGPNPELYDLETDPLEHHDVVAERPADASALRDLLREREGPDADRFEGSGIELSVSDQQRLAALGYLVGDGVAAGDGALGPDPKAMLPIFVEMQGLKVTFDRNPQFPDWSRIVLPLLGKRLIETREELAARLEELAAAHPDFAPVYQELALQYDELKRPDDAARARKRFEALTGRRDTPVATGQARGEGPT